MRAIKTFKPCPFCKKTKIILKRAYRSNGWYTHCANCGAAKFKGPYAEGYASPTTARTAWNRRVL